MKLFPYLTIISLIITVNTAQSTRFQRDSVGFCYSAHDMDEVLAFLEETSPATNINNGKLIGGIAPHDDYLYSAKVTYPLFKDVHPKEVIIFGVTHRTVRDACGDQQNVIILDSFDNWQEPYGIVAISPLREVIKNKLNKEYYIVNNTAHSLEHSIESLIPYLQYNNREVKITPIMITIMNYELMGNITSSLSEIVSGYLKDNSLRLGDDVLIIISNDANHYGKDFKNDFFGLDEKAHALATSYDINICNNYLEGPVTENRIKKMSEVLWDNVEKKDYTPLWCGRYPIVFGLEVISKLVNQSDTITCSLIKYSDTLTEGVLPIKNTNLGVTAPYSLEHWVGFFSMGIYLND